VPELPEVETMVRGIRPFVEGRTIAELRACHCTCRPISITPSLPELSRRIRGQLVTTVRRLAKRVVFDLSSGESLVIEPRMTGLMLLADPPDLEHLRLQWQLAGPIANPASNGRSSTYDSLWFWDRRGLGTVRLYGAAELADQLGPHKLGVDALLMDDAAWQESCSRTSRPIKVALLDQKLAAGIGNLYASEILHRAKIHPALPANQLKRAQISRLRVSVIEVLQEAIGYEGSTLGDGTYRNALNQAGSYQNAHRVYNRTEEQCPTCHRAKIKRIVQAQRSTFYCPSCQKQRMPKDEG
jgi:formamidopyrimidine-DNA glycosylase